MTVTQGKPIPVSTMLSAIDEQARLAVKDAQSELAPIVTRETPRKSGKTAAALRPRVSRTATGQALTVGAPRAKIHDGRATIAEVVRWVNRGTGIYRDTPGMKRRIRSPSHLPKRMVLPGGRMLWSVKGQRPNPFIKRIYELGTPRVQAAFERGAGDAARAAERVIG